MVTARILGCITGVYVGIGTGGSFDQQDGSCKTRGMLAANASKIAMDARCELLLTA